MVMLPVFDIQVRWVQTMFCNKQDIIFSPSHIHGAILTLLVMPALPLWSTVLKSNLSNIRWTLYLEMITKSLNIKSLYQITVQVYLFQLLVWSRGASGSFLLLLGFPTTFGAFLSFHLMD